MVGEVSIVPAICYREQVLEKFRRNFYSDEMILASGDLSAWVPSLDEVPDGSKYEWAIVSSNNSELIGFLSYCVDWYSSVAYNFGVYSFTKGNPLIGKVLFDTIEKMLNEWHLHKVEWKMVGGNPVEESYDAFCNFLGGNKVVLHDCFKDRAGNYRDVMIYEVFNREN